MGDDERDKLRTLLGYWIQHNNEHGQEFTEGADRAKALGEVEGAREMLQASQEMKKANKFLSRALRRLQED